MFPYLLKLLNEVKGNKGWKRNGRETTKEKGETKETKGESGNKKKIKKNEVRIEKWDEEMHIYNKQTKAHWLSHMQGTA